MARSAFRPPERQVVAPGQSARGFANRRRQRENTPAPKQAAPLAVQIPSRSVDGGGGAGAPGSRAASRRETKRSRAAA
eukprot:9650281-Alexandrium_andersonii.AAC.1